jgi:hypothetical protein
LTNEKKQGITPMLQDPFIASLGDYANYAKFPSLWQ